MVPAKNTYSKVPRFNRRERGAVKALGSALRALLGDRLVMLRLYGSRARGDHEKDSDIDIAVVVRGLNGRLKVKVLNVVAGVELEYLTPLSALVLGEAEFFELKGRERRLALDIEQEGMDL